MNDLPIDVQLAVVNASLTLEWLRVGLAAAAASAFLAACAVGARNWDRVRRVLRRPAVMFFVAAFTLYAGFKPVVRWPTGVTGGVAEFDEGVWSYLTLHWTKRASYPDDATLSVYAVEKTGDRLRFHVGDMSAGAYSNTFYAASFPKCYTNYDFVVESDYDPGVVRIDDLRSVASTTNLAVTCRWTAPESIVGAPAWVQYRRIDWPLGRWDNLDVVTTARTNVFHASGNFISVGIDRQFRVVVPDFAGSRKAKMVKMMDSEPLKLQAGFARALFGTPERNAARRRERELYLLRPRIVPAKGGSR